MPHVAGNQSRHGLPSVSLDGLSLLERQVPRAAVERCRLRHQLRGSRQRVLRLAASTEGAGAGWVYTFVRLGLAQPIGLMSRQPSRLGLAWRSQHPQQKRAAGHGSQDGGHAKTAALRPSPPDFAHLCIALLLALVVLDCPAARTGLTHVVLVFTTLQGRAGQRLWQPIIRRRAHCTQHESRGCMRGHVYRPAAPQLN